ncbi:MAG: hypothetical protein HYZ28_23395 [Myxococcales bacterium]|nr:hypothetical protein [Myxococcales bacterium]
MRRVLGAAAKGGPRPGSARAEPRKRSLSGRFYLAPLAALMLAGCPPQQTATPANISGTVGMLQVGQLLFVTSSDRHELRALDLSIPDTHDWVRAPNALEPLSIPVLDRPSGLVRDVRYSDDPPDSGTPAVEIVGPYVYAISAGAPEISIVWANYTKPDGGLQEEAKGQLTELMRLPTSAPVTAVAARGPADGGPSTLYFATFESSGASTWSLPVRPPNDLADAGPGSVLAGQKLLASAAGESVSALLPLPRGRLVIATRKEAGRGGRTVLLDEATLATTPLPFPGPVRHLATHERSAALAGEAGQNVFGILEETVCSPTGCGGLLAVDVGQTPPSIARDYMSDGGRNTMVPIRFGDGLVQGLALASDVSIAQPDGTAATLPVLGLATTSTGEIFIFNAGELRQIDTDGNSGGVSLQSITVLEADGSQRPYAEFDGGFRGPIFDDPNTTDVDENPAAADGAARDELISLTFEGRIPGLIDVPTPNPPGTRFSAEQASRAAPGDRILFAGTPGAGVDGGSGCEKAVVAVEPAAIVTEPIPPGCESPFTVRASGRQPYVVAGSATGFMGRVGNSQSFVYTGEYFHHPDGVDTSKPQLELEMGPGGELSRDDRYLIPTQSGFAPYVTAVDTELASIGRNLFHPGSVVINKAGSRILVAYPPADMVLELNPALLTPGLVRNVVPYR